MTPRPTGDPAGRSAPAAGLAAVWERTRPVLQARAEQIAQALSAVIAGTADDEGLRDAERAAHMIAGSAGMFGLHRATDIARELETFLGPGADRTDTRAAATRMARLRRELAGPPASKPPTNEPVVLIAHPDAGRAEALAAAAAQRGLSSVEASTPDTARALLAQHRITAVLLDLDLAGARTTELITEAHTRHPDAPTLVLSSDDHFLDRVDAARAGARGILSSALPDEAVIGAVVDALARHTHNQERLLAVDDDPVILDMLRELFRESGLALTTVEEPLEFWDALVQTSPDLLLLDLDMPTVTGLELCRLLRADPRWEALPVLVLSGRLGPEAVHEVFAAGADDYVTKPVVGAELVTRVTNRLERVRLYRQLAETDVLTGLANRRKFTSEFDRLARLAARYGQPLSFALLDLDKFKAVNDRYGHATGDAVLQRLGEVLRRHFRGEDVVARWGGEEIALALYGMSRTDGVARVAGALEAMRDETFAATDLPTLRVSFSGGVAEWGADGADLHALYQVADEVLYRAKALGGNRILTTIRPGEEAAVEDDDAVDVVVIEDDETMAEVLSDALTTRGLRSLRIADGAEAVARLTSAGASRPRIVLLDIDLPGMNGLDVLDDLQRAGVLRHTKVIMLTSRSAENEVLAAFHRGAFDHVLKPFSIPVLMQRIRRALAAS